MHEDGRVIGELVATCCGVGHWPLEGVGPLGLAHPLSIFPRTSDWFLSGR
jgi:hypothetical protein